MGLVLYGGGIAQISGSVGGDVHFRNRYGNCIRPRTHPVNPNSARQVDVRAKMAMLAEYWSDTLTIAQRAQWEVYAAAVAMTNRIGQTIHLTGFNHFIRSNAAQQNWFAGVTAAGPTILELPAQDPTLTCSEEDIAGQTFTFTFDNAGWAANGDSKVRMLLYQGLPQVAGRMFFGGPFRYMYDVDTVEGAAGTATCAAVFPFALDQKVWFQARLQTDSRRVTELWRPDSRIITADA